MSDYSSSDGEIQYERKKKKRQRSRSRSPHKSKKHKKHRQRYSDSEEEDQKGSHRGRVREDQRDHRRKREEYYDPHKRIKQEPDDNQRQQKRDRERNDERRRRARQQRDRENEDDNFQFGEGQHMGPGQPSNVKTEPKEKEKPNFKVSGKLTEDTNTYRGVVIKYNEPPEARKPRRRWRLYPFKGEQTLPMLHVHRQSAYLFGRDRRVADIPVDHPSCSKQHAVLQFRLVDAVKDGRVGRQVKPYVIDLGSANGTFVNNKQVDAERYIELLEKDVLKFGFSTREYVLLHEKADTTELHDDEELSD